MFAVGVPEKLIADKTGHHSLQLLEPMREHNPVWKGPLTGLLQIQHSRFLQKVS